MTNVVLLIEIYTGLPETVSIANVNRVFYRVSTSECRYTPILFRRKFLSVEQKLPNYSDETSVASHIYSRNVIQIAHIMPEFVKFTLSGVP